MPTTTLVLLPGMDGTGTLFDPLRERLPASMPVEVVGYPRDRPLGYPELTRVALDALPAGRPVVVLGESFSGPIALRLAAERRDDCRGVILSASFASSPYPVGRLAGLVDAVPIRAFARGFGPRWLMGRWKTPELVERYEAALDAVAPDVLRARVRAVAAVDETATLASIDRPTLYLRPSADRVVPPSSVRTFSRFARSGTVETIDGPHLLLQCAPAPSARAIAAFVGARDPLTS